MNSDPLIELRDWHVPPPVSWWPPAPGWWLLAGLLLMGLLWAMRWWVKRRRRTAGRRVALVELDRYRQEFAEHGDSRRFAAAISQLLRRLALVRFPRADVAGLVGQDWLEFLDRTGGAGEFTQGVGRLLVELVYRDDVSWRDDLEPDRLVRLATAWIRTNGVEGCR